MSLPKLLRHLRSLPLWAVGAVIVAGSLVMVVLAVAIWASFFPNYAGEWDRSLLLGWVQALTSLLAFTAVIVVLSVAIRQLKIVSRPSQVLLDIQLTMSRELSQSEDTGDGLIVAARVLPGAGAIREFTYQLVLTHDVIGSVYLQPLPIGGGGLQPTNTYYYHGHTDEKTGLTTTIVTVEYKGVELYGVTSLWLGSVQTPKGLFHSCKWAVFNPSWVTQGTWSGLSEDKPKASADVDTISE